MPHTISFSFLLSLMLALAGCVSPGSSTKGPWQAYQKFEAALASEARPDISPYLSDATYNSIAHTENKAEREALFAYASYPLWLANEREHYEKKTPGGACLTVNGVTHDGHPGALSVAYVAEDGRFKADEIHYDYLGEDKPFPTDAKCPSDLELAYPE